MRRSRGFFRSLLRSKPESVVTPEADRFANEFAVPGKRTVITGGYKVELDLTSQVLAVKAPIDRDFDVDYGDDFNAGPAEARLKATVDWTDTTDFLSASVLAQKAK